ncbi:phage tail-like protein [Dyadobacter jejuensis]|uniref:Phage tail-like protein n=1 Tax=Dyadobacter jejuensis TaxID=1082580 RepID=A0A316AJG6_9BACT|nr:phage tail protein [Dyadobacter jejuensis]PWJ57468.1 phage tail-like protein [Dyadobacter jejuensis]
MPYPLPVFRFKVEEVNASDPTLGVAFSEISGLTQEIQIIEYRDGLTSQQSAMKMPGIQKVNNVTLKRGIIKGDNAFYDWLNTVKLNTISRKDLIISLLDENDLPAMVWNIKQAFPVKVEGPSLKATGNEIAVESIELAHEGLTVSNG